VLREERLRAVEERRARDVDRQVAQRGRALEQRADEAPRLPRAPAAELDEIAPLAGERRDLGGVRGQDLVLRAREVVLRQPADLLEQRRPDGVVEESARQALGRGGETPLDLGREVAEPGLRLGGEDRETLPDRRILGARKVPVKEACAGATRSYKVLSPC
jgi:hypothetical protein